MPPDEPPLRLRSLLSPTRIAIVGASERNHYASSLLKNLKQFHFPEENLFLVNPRYDNLRGRTCYPGLTAISADVDLAVLAIPPAATLKVLEEAVAKRVKSVLMVATGFGEFNEDGIKLQNKILGIAKEGGITIGGPNTLGFLSTQGGVALWSSPLPERLQNGSVGAVFHSSGLLNLFFNTAADRCVGFRYGIAAGNEVDLNLTDYLAWMVHDPEVRVLVTLIESVKNPDDLISLLDIARDLGKPIVALRVGKSTKGSRAIVSHTGNLATSGAAWQALFKQRGVLSVDNMDQMLETVVALVHNPCGPISKSTKGMGIVTISGGDCSFLSDIAERIGLSLPDPSPNTYESLKPYFGKANFNGNPLDIEDLHQADPSKFFECLKDFSVEGSFDLIGCRLSLPKTPNERLKELYARTAAVVQEQGKGIVFLSRASELLDPSWFEFFSQLNLPFLLEYEKSLRAVNDLLWWSNLQEPPQETTSPENLENDSAVTKIRGMIQTAKNDTLSYLDTRNLLSAFGIPLAKDALAQSANDAIKAAIHMGFPVALKVVSPDLPHKTEEGALLTNLETAPEVEKGFEELSQKMKRRLPQVAVEGILVQKMVPGVTEVIVGTHHDPQLGPVVLFGLGGIYAEILNDVSLRLPPMSHRDAQEMLDELKGIEMLRGARGRPKGDEPAVIDIILKVCRMAADLEGALETIELNPIIVLPEGQGALAVDTLIRRRA